DAARALLARDPRKERMACVRARDRAGSLIAVERDRIGAELLAPECRFEALAQRLRLGGKPCRRIRSAERATDLGHLALGRIDIRLHLRERDRAGGEAAVGVRDRVLRVFPALVREPLV